MSTKAGSGAPGLVRVSSAKRVVLSAGRGKRGEPGQRREGRGKSADTGAKDTSRHGYADPGCTVSLSLFKKKYLLSLFDCARFQLWHAGSSVAPCGI